MQALRPLQRYFEFGGRSGRAEYWQYIALYVAAIAIATVLDYSSGNLNDYGGTPTITLILIVGTLVPTYAVTFRRLHDVGRSGWWVGVSASFGFVDGFLIGFGRALAYTPSAPVINAVTVAVYIVQFVISLYCIYLLLRRGDPVDNRYGAPPAAFPEAFPMTQSGVGPISTAPNFLTKLSQGDPLVQIERLSKLRAEGALTEEEFAAQKTELLKRL